MEINWLIHGSDVDREITEIMRSENFFMESGFKTGTVARHRVLLLSLCAQEAEALIMAC